MRSAKWMMLCGLMMWAGCGEASVQPAPPPDVVGPFTGTPQRFVMDRLELPMKNKDMAEDLDGDGRVDNQLAFAVATIVAGAPENLSLAEPLLAGGRIATSVELVSDDAALQSDDTVGLVWHGSPDDPGATLAGKLDKGAFASNLTRYTTHPVTATVVLPLFAESDPVALQVDGAEVRLTPDGEGGYDGELHGGIEMEDAWRQGYRSLSQMFNHNPQRHRQFFYILWVFMDEKKSDVSYDDFLANPLIENATQPDVQLHRDGRWAPTPRSKDADFIPDSMSLGFRFHLKPCESGRCAPEIAPTCDDRLMNGDETDVDCGGSCPPCGANLACKDAMDCQSRACDDGVCAAPSCTDGVQDGFEAHADCGGSCPGCPDGNSCEFRFDCAELCSDANVCVPFTK